MVDNVAGHSAHQLIHSESIMAPDELDTQKRATRIFLSSTSRDLREHREAVVRRCQTRGYSLVAMEEFGAQDASASSVSVSEVAPCDVFVGVYARRYGYVPEGATRSVTEMEYDEA